MVTSGIIGNGEAALASFFLSSSSSASFAAFFFGSRNVGVTGRMTFVAGESFNKLESIETSGIVGNGDAGLFSTFGVRRMLVKARLMLPALIN